MSTSGLHGSVLLVGPDGAGKTAAADAISDALGQLGTPVLRAHFRPGILFSRSPTGPVTEPHRHPPRSVVASLAKLSLVFADHMVGAFSTWRRARHRGVLLVERGWHDMAVDPLRYRLPPTLVRAVLALGRALPKHDLAVVIDGPAQAIHDRKPELTIDEIERQRGLWGRLAAVAAHQTMVVDSVQRTPSEIASLVVDYCERSSEASWIRTPLAPRRLRLATQGTRRSTPALAIYRPHRWHARVAARLNGKLAARGVGLRVANPVPDLHDLTREIGIAYDGAAAFRSSMANRYIVGLAREGSLRVVLKIGAPEDEGLEREATALERLQRPRAHVLVPRLIWRGEWRGRRVVVTEALSGVAPASADLDAIADICSALCTDSEAGPLVHGDFTPWNLLQGPSGTYLLDWEEYRQAFEPLHDLTHYVIRSGALLGSYEPEESVAALTAPGSPGWRHLEELGVDAKSAQDRVAAYLAQADGVSAPVARFQRAIAGCLG